MEQNSIITLAATCAALVGDIVQTSVSSWRAELKVLKNVEVHPSIFATLLLEATIFGHYYIQEKFRQYINKDDYDSFSYALNEQVIYISSLLFEHKDKEEDFEGHKKMIREMYELFAPAVHQQLSQYKGNSILDILQVNLKRIFNTSDYSTVRFFENTILNQLRMKIAALLTSDDGANNKYVNDIFLDEKIVNTLAQTLLLEFSKLDYHELSRYPYLNS